MKKNKILIVILSCIIPMVGCTNIIDKEIILSERMHIHANVESAISDHAELFGNVLIVDNIEEAENLVDYWNTLSYDELRVDYASYNFYSKVIESNIVYDSLLSTYMAFYGISDLSEDMDQAQYDMFHDLESIIADYEDIIPIQTMYDETLGYNIMVIEPIGDIDLNALTNEYDIFIADTIVYKSLPNGIISIPISSYFQYANYSAEELSELAQCQDENVRWYISIEQIWDHMPPSEMFSDYNEVVYSNDEVYRMNVRLTPCGKYSSWYGTTKLYTDFKIKNYKLGGWGWFYWRTQFDTYGDYNYTYEAFTNDHPHDIQEYQAYYVNEHTSYYHAQHTIAEYAYYDFRNPHYGFISFHINVTNNRVSLNISESI